jgi:hypothetical protein
MDGEDHTVEHLFPSYGVHTLRGLKSKCLKVQATFARFAVMAIDTVRLQERLDQRSFGPCRHAEQQEHYWNLEYYPKGHGR